MASVTLDRLSKTFAAARRQESVTAVQPLDLRVEDGEFLVLMGPSGSGKSTILRMIAGLETPSSGRILIDEEDVTHQEPRDRDIAMVFQSYALYPHMTVRQNLAFGLAARRTPRPDILRRVDDTARKLGLAPLLDRKPAALSGGQRQRVALGRAIIRQPRVFLFDEPLSNLDARLRVHTRAELVSLHRELAATMIYVTHDQTEAMTMGQRIAVLHDGALQQVAPPLELYDAPANILVAGSIGSPPMNLFPGRLRSVDGSLRFVGASFTLPCTLSTAPPEVILGIRPEHLRPASDADGAISQATVLVVEPLGSETILYCRTDHGEDAAVRVPGRTGISPHSRIGIAADAARLHWFHADTGCRLERP